MAMDVPVDNALQPLLSEAGRDPEVLSVILFGSRARYEAFSGSDVDIAIVLTPGRYSRYELSRKRLSYLERFPGLDIHIFQGLPLQVRHRVLKEGEILWTRDEDILYELAYRTARMWEDFRPRYLMAVEGHLAGP